MPQERDPSARERHGQLRRSGNIQKCPACGVPMDPDAYRCPRCLIYFCFKCRRRVQQRDPQFQCMNQQCGQYGKLLCGACVVEEPVTEDRPRQELVKARELVKASEIVGTIPKRVIKWTFIFIFGIAVIAGIWIWIITRIWFGIGCGLAGFFLAGFTAEWLDSRKERTKSVFAEPEFRTVIEKVEVGRRKCCIACRQPVEHL